MTNADRLKPALKLRAELKQRIAERDELKKRLRQMNLDIEAAEADLSDELRRAVSGGVEVGTVYVVDDLAVSVSMPPGKFAAGHVPYKLNALKLAKEG